MEEVVVDDVKNFADMSDPADPGELQDRYMARASRGLTAYFSRPGYAVSRLAASVKTQTPFYRALHAAVRLDPARWAREITRGTRLIERLLARRVLCHKYLVVGDLSTGGFAAYPDLVFALDLFVKGAIPDDIIATLPPWVRFWMAEPSSLALVASHEVVHAAQASGMRKNLLQACLYEGLADFLTFRACGTHSSVPVHRWAASRREILLDRFHRERLSAQLAPWLHCDPQHFGIDWPPNVGYFVGFEVVKSFVGATPLDSELIGQLLALDDFEQFYERSRIAGGRRG